MPKADSPVSGPPVMRPRLGLRPTSPQHDAGMRMEPAPSMACAMGTARAATNAAAPPLEPPTPRSVSHGLRVGPLARLSVAKLRPSSGIVVTPRVAMPAVRNRAIRSVSRRATMPRRPELPSWNGTPSAIGTSLIRNGIPVNGPSPACWRATGNIGPTKALTSSSAAARALLAAFSTSAVLTWRVLISSRRPMASYRVYSWTSMRLSSTSGAFGPCGEQPAWVWFIGNGGQPRGRVVTLAVVRHAGGESGRRGCQNRRVAVGSDRQVFVGRGPELAMLQEAMVAAATGSGGVILVSGPAGIGKSRLVAEAVRVGRRVVRGRCVADGGAPPLWPWLRVLGRVRPDLRLDETAAGADATREGDPRE